MLLNLFTAHPNSVGETYFQHFGLAFSFFIKLLLASMAALIHAFLPFAFEKTASKAIDILHQRMVLSRRKSCVDPDVETST